MSNQKQKQMVIKWLVGFEQSGQHKEKTINEALSLCQEALGETTAPTMAKFRGIATSLGITFQKGHGGNKSPLLATLCSRLNAVEHVVNVAKTKTENEIADLVAGYQRLLRVVEDLALELKELRNTKPSIVRWATDETAQ